MTAKFFDRPNFRRFSFNFKEGGAVLGGIGGTGSLLALYAFECLTKLGKVPECVIFAHPSKKLVQDRIKNLPFFLRSRGIPVYANGNIAGLGKSLEDGVKAKGKWYASRETAIFNKAFCNFLLEKYSDAITDLITLEPSKDKSVYRILADCYDKIGEYEKAIKYWQMMGTIIIRLDNYSKTVDSNPS